MAPCEVYSMPFTTVLFTTCYSRVTGFGRQKEVWTASWRVLSIYLCVNASVDIGFSCGTDTLARAQAK